MLGEIIGNVLDKINAPEWQFWKEEIPDRSSTLKQRRVNCTVCGDVALAYGYCMNHYLENVVCVYCGEHTNGVIFKDCFDNKICVDCSRRQNPWDIFCDLESVAQCEICLLLDGVYYINYYPCLDKILCEFCLANHPPPPSEDYSL